MDRRNRGKGAWTAYQDLDPDAEVTWAQINAKVDEIIAEPRPRRHSFSGEEKREKETVTILPHGAKQIKVHWIEDE